MPNLRLLHAISAVGALVGLPAPKPQAPSEEQTTPTADTVHFQRTKVKKRANARVKAMATTSNSKVYNRPKYQGPPREKQPRTERKEHLSRAQRKKRNLKQIVAQQA